MDGTPLQKHSTTTYTRFNKPVLRPPIESAQYTSIAFAETLVLEGIAASIGSVGDAYACENEFWSLDGLALAYD
ncbi:hypothetical protein [Mycobacterium sp.]|uniref:hypothetical protein n=1 Tax=Mycobacterium sp. TaxID=1785 RepID=UPI0025D2189B|nr:hypothetical protein [Mycobacterium sp.]